MDKFSLADAVLFDPNTYATTLIEMNERRDSHTATLLLDGRVFVAGGRSLDRPTQPSFARDSTEIFDPLTNVFTPGPQLTTPRFGHTATRLSDGRVLLLGGMATALDSFMTWDEPTDVLSSGELYDANTNAVEPLSTSMFEKRYGHTAVLDANAGGLGRVCVDGGLFMPSSGAVGAGSEYYDIETKAFSGIDASGPGLRRHHAIVAIDQDRRALIGGEDIYWLDRDDMGKMYPLDVQIPGYGWHIPLVIPRTHHTATLLPTGAVLITGGLDAKWSLNYAEVLPDPFTHPNPASVLTGRSGNSRSGHTATLLPDGAVVIVGGLDMVHGLPWHEGMTLSDILVYVYTASQYSKYKLDLGGVGG